MIVFYLNNSYDEDESVEFIFGIDEMYFFEKIFRYR